MTGNGVTIKGLTLNGTDDGSGEINKVIEVVGDGFKLQFSVVGAADGIEVASTVYISDDVVSNDPSFVSDITSFLIDHNVLEGSVVVTNGAGVGHPIPSIDFKITDNDFVMNPGSDSGYNWGIILNGHEATIPWRVASIVLPKITGNTFTDDYAIYLRALDDDPAKMPDRAYVDAFIANNVAGDYAFATEADGDLQMASAANRFFIHNALDAAVGDALSGGTVVFRVEDDTTYTVNKDNLTFDAQDGSGAITLQLGTANNVNLDGDQAVTVLGNGNANVINGNDADNYISGGNGGDTINGLAGNDTIDGGDGIDTVQGYDASYHVARDGGEWVVRNNTDTDSLTNVEKAVVDGQTTWLVDTAAELTYALANAVDGDIVQLAEGTYEGTFTVNDKQLTILGANAGTDGDGSRTVESIIKGHLVLNGTKAVNVDGVEFFADGTTGTTGHGNAAVQLHGSGTYTIQNSLFFSDFVGRQRRGHRHHDRHHGVGPCHHRRQLLHRHAAQRLQRCVWQRGIWSDGSRHRSRHHRQRLRVGPQRPQPGRL